MFQLRKPFIIGFLWGEVPYPPPRPQASAKLVERKVAFSGHMASEGAGESSPSES